MEKPAHDSLLIIDFGSQVTQLIARRVREAGVYCEIHPYQSAAAAFEKLQPKGVIFSGGPDSVTRDGSPRAPQAVFDSGVPILAICYGQQTMAVIKSHTAEGLLVVDITGQEKNIPHQTITADTTLPTSLMPMGLDQTMPEAELLDLVAWLRSLK